MDHSAEKLRLVGGYLLQPQPQPKVRARGLVESIVSMMPCGKAMDMPRLYMGNVRPIGRIRNIA